MYSVSTNKLREYGMSKKWSDMEQHYIAHVENPEKAELEWTLKEIFLLRDI